jgi:hypothetical protein
MSDLRALLQAVEAGKIVDCPLCGDTGFDHIGLAMHYTRGWCPGLVMAHAERPCDAAAALRAKLKEGGE